MSDINPVFSRLDLATLSHVTPQKPIREFISTPCGHVSSP